MLIYMHTYFCQSKLFIYLYEKRRAEICRRKYQHEYVFQEHVFLAVLFPLEVIMDNQSICMLYKDRYYKRKYIVISFN